MNIDCAFNLAKFLPQNFSASSLETSPLLSKSILSKNDLSFACRTSVSVPSLLVKVCVSPASSISCPRPPPMTTASGANAGLFTGLSFTAPSRETRVPLLASPTSSLFLRRICAMCQNGFCARERGRATAIGRQSEESVLSVRSRNVSRGWPAWPLRLWPSHLDLLQHGVVYGILDYRFELVRGKVGRHLFRGGHAGHVGFKLFQVSSRVEAAQGSTSRWHRGVRSRTMYMYQSEHRSFLSEISEDPRLFRNLFSIFAACMVRLVALCAVADRWLTSADRRQS